VSGCDEVEHNRYGTLTYGYPFVLWRVRYSGPYHFLTRPAVEPRGLHALPVSNAGYICRSRARAWRGHNLHHRPATGDRRSVDRHGQGGCDISGYRWSQHSSGHLEGHFTPKPIAEKQAPRLWDRRALFWAKMSCLWVELRANTPLDCAERLELGLGQAMVRLCT
jgi:hypothetical protein